MGSSTTVVVLRKQPAQRPQRPLDFHDVGHAAGPRSGNRGRLPAVCNSIQASVPTQSEPAAGDNRLQRGSGAHTTRQSFFQDMAAGYAPLFRLLIRRAVLRREASCEIDEVEGNSP